MSNNVVQCGWAALTCQDGRLCCIDTMPLTALVRQLQQAPLTGEVAARINRSERLRLGVAAGPAGPW